jgi:hypothetical protein
MALASPAADQDQDARHAPDCYVRQAVLEACAGVGACRAAHAQRDAGGPVRRY